MTFAARLLTGLGHAFNRNAGAQLTPMVTALTADVETADAMLATTQRQWPVLFDLDETPTPGWLAQLAGVTVDPALDPARQRELILSRPAWVTGTYVALVAALKAALKGQQRVVVTERDTSVWHATIIVHESDFAPGTTTAVVEAIAESHRPAGMTFSVVFVSATSYGAAELDADTYGAAESTAGTYGAAEH